MTRRERAAACAVGIIPVSIAGIAVLKCGCAFAAFAGEISVGLLYFIWIML